MDNLLLCPITIEKLTEIITEAVKNQLDIHSKSNKDLAKENSFISRKEAAKILGISLPTLNDWTKKELIPSYKIASTVRYKKNEIENALNQRSFIPKNR